MLMLTTVGCELFDSNYWDAVDKRSKERGHKCYENYKGNFYCEDTKQNIDSSNYGCRLYDSRHWSEYSKSGKERLLSIAETQNRK